MYSDTDTQKPKEKKPKSKKYFWLWFFVFLIFLIKGSFLLFNYLQQPPKNFPNTELVEIKTGSTLRDVAKISKDKGLVKSELFFYTYFIAFHDPADIKASNYVFSKPLTVKDLSERFTKGSYAEGLKKITLTEGSSVKVLAKQIKLTIPEFNTEEFIEISEPFEGYLFPETYLIPANYSPQELTDLLKETFLEKISKLEAKIKESELTLNEIIILASIVEREANSVESQKMVSGILQNRIKEGMPLQADATMEYVLGKPLAELTADDLKIDSPYNTYLNYGLPPTPIGNPGIDAILAVLEPTASDNLFYITGKDGEFYYAKTFDQHRVNIARYLR